MLQCVNMKTGVVADPPTPLCNEGEEEDREEENLEDKNCVSPV